MHLASFIFCGLVALASGHAVLNNPPAWNPQPSTRAPCGGANAARGGVTQLNVQAGGTLSLAWEVVAGDGNGPVTVKMDPNGGTQFQVDMPVTGANANPRVGKYTIAVRVPQGTKCGANGCSFQVKSSTNWYSCSTVAFQVPPPPPTPLPTQSPVTKGPTEPLITLSPTRSPTAPTPFPTVLPTAVPTPKPKLCLKRSDSGSDFRFCTMMNNQPVAAYDQNELVQNDLLAQNVWKDDTENKNVFKQTTQICKDNYKRVLCNKYLPACGASLVKTCKGNCQRTNSCMDPSHQGLLNCEDTTAYTDKSDNTGDCEAFNTSGNGNSGNENMSGVQRASPHFLAVATMVVFLAIIH